MIYDTKKSTGRVQLLRVRPSKSEEVVQNRRVSWLSLVDAE